MTNKLQQNYPQFFELNGTALNDGYIYIGVDGLDPTTNPIPVYLDASLTTPISQPLRTTGGYVYYNGNPVSIYFGASNYSITIKNSLSSLIYTNLSAYTMPFVNTAMVVENIAELKTFSNAEANQIEVLGYYSKGDGGGGTFYWDSSSTEADNGGTIIQTTGVTIGRWKRVFSGAVNVKWFGAKGDGVTDDTVSIQKAFATGKNIIYGRYAYKISDSIPVASNITVDSYGATINWTGLSTVPLYTITAPASEININGGLYTGTPSAWLLATGVSSNPSSITDYARFKVIDVNVSGALLFIDAQKAARFKIKGVQTYTENGINCYGKIVEIKISDSVIFGSSGATGTYGISTELYAGAASTSYPEGLHITNCTIDGFEKTIRLIDIFVAVISNSYISGSNIANIAPIYIKKGNSTHCEDIIISNNTITGWVDFDVLSSGNNYYATISNNIFIGTSNVSIYLRSNTYFVKIIGNIFKSAINNTSTFAVFVANNVGNIDMIENSVDDTYLRAFQSTGSNGNNINVISNSSTLTTPLFFSRPTNSRLNSINENLSVNITGTVASGNNFTGSITSFFAKGEKLLLNISINMSNTAAGYLAIILPSGVTAPSGSGWSNTLFYFPITTTVTNRNITIPLFVNNDTSGIIYLQNYSMSSATADYHSVMSLIKI